MYPASVLAICVVIMFGNDLLSKLFDSAVNTSCNIVVWLCN